MTAASGRDRINFAILCLSSAAAMFNMSAMPNLLNQLMEQFGIGFAEASRVIYFHMTAYGLTALFVVVLNRALTRFRTLLIAHVLLLGLNVAIASADDFVVISGLRLLTGVSSCVVIPTSLSIIGDAYGSSKTAMVGYFFGTNAAVGIAGATLSGILDWRMLFYLPSILSAASVLALLVGFDHLALTRSDRSRPFSWRRKITAYYLIARRREKLGLFLMIFINSFFGAGFISYVGVYLKRELGVPVSSVGLILSVGVCGSIVISLTIGWLARHLSAKARVIIGMLGAGTVFLLFPRNALLPLFFGLLFFSGMSRAITHNTLVAAFLDFPKRLRGAASSLNSFIVFIGGALGVRLMQASYARFGFRESLTAVAVVIGSGVVLVGLRTGGSAYLFSTKGGVR